MISFRKIFENIRHLGFESILKMLISFGLNAWLARSLGPNDFGLYGYVLSYGLLFSPFYEMGIDYITIKYVVDTDKSRESILGTSFLIKLLGGLFGFILVSTFAYLTENADTHLFKLILILCGFQLLKSFDPVSAYFIGLSRSKVVTNFRNLSVLILAIIKVYLLFKGYSWEWFIYVSCFEFLLHATGYFFLIGREKFSVFNWSLNKDLLSAMFKETLPLLLFTIFNMGVSRIDHIMIKKFVSAEDLGQFTAAVRLIYIWQFLPAVIATSFYPRMLQAKKANTNEYSETILLAYGSVVFICFGLIAGVYLLGDPIVSLLYGSDYQDTAKYLLMYSCLTLFSFTLWPRLKFFIAEGKTNLGAILAGLTFVINIPLNWILIQKYNVVGAVYASLSSFVIANLVLALFSKTIRKSLIDLAKFPKFILLVFKKMGSQ